MIVDATIEVDRHLLTLEQAELVRQTARNPELEYMFRHELTRDAAYTSILRRQRREFHRQVGDALEAMLGERVEDEAHRLAYHFWEAQDYERALRYYRAAGDAAYRLYATREAEAAYARARLRSGNRGRF